MWLIKPIRSNPTVAALGFIALCITILQLVFVNNYINPHSQSLINGAQARLQLAFTAEKGFEVVQSWGEGGRERYLQVIGIDLIWPLTYGPFFAMLIYRMKGGLFWSIVPLFEALTNWTETGLEIHWILHATPALPMQTVFLVHSIVASIKWFMCIPTYFIHTFYLLWRNRHFMRRYVENNKL